MRPPITSATAATAAKLPSGLLLPTQAGEYLGLTSSTLAAWRVQGKGPDYVKYGGRIKYDKGALDAFIANSVKAASGGEAKGHV